MTIRKVGRPGWLLAAISVVVVGVTVSIVSAQSLARSDGQKAQQASETTSTEIASTLTLAIQREQDLAVNTGAFVIETPDATQAQFGQWIDAARVFPRFPELVGIGEVILVPAAQVETYLAGVEPASPPGSGVYPITPPGSRPFYCFAPLSRGRADAPSSPPNLDLCTSDLGPKLIEARDAATSAYVPYGTGKGAHLAIGTAFYRGGVIPASVAARRSAFMGWVGIQITPAVVLTTALAGHPHTAVAFHYRSPSSNVTFRAGTMPPGAQATTVDLRNGWHVAVLSVVRGSGVGENPNALVLLLGGIVVSLLLALLLHVLATSRARALAVVREQTGELRHQALHDPLTGLPNRALILDRIEQMMVQGRRLHTPVAALFLDLDDFKDVNDTLGHAAGDELLIAVGARLGEALREGDTVGRLGGDEFIVLVEGASLPAGAAGVADRLLDVMSAPFRISASDVPLTVTVSIGSAEGDRPTPGRLLQDADIALYQAKAAGKACAVAFSPSMQEAIDGRRGLEIDLDGALAAEQFFLVYQPTIDLRSGLYTGVEALLRWRHPERGVIGPDQFIPALESSGLIIPVGAWVLDEACRQGAAWHRQGHRFVVSVNLSARQLERDRIVDDVARALAASGLEPGSLILELTETALMNNVSASVTRLQLLKNLGVRIAIDDFGTGYSSLAYLRQFPIDVLKIDQSFVGGITETAEAAALVHTLIQLGKVLGLVIVAEGIETVEQRIFLEDEGVDIGQGYLFSRPLEVDDLERLLENRSDRHDVRTG